MQVVWTRLILFRLASKIKKIKINLKKLPSYLQARSQGEGAGFMRGLGPKGPLSGVSHPLKSSLATGLLIFVVTSHIAGGTFSKIVRAHREMAM